MLSRVSAVRDALVKEGIFDSVAPVLHLPIVSATTVSGVCRITCLFSRDCGDHAASLVRAGIIPFVLRAMTEHQEPPAMVDRCLVALRRLALPGRTAAFGFASTDAWLHCSVWLCIGRCMARCLRRVQWRR